MITHEQARMALRKAFDYDTPQGITKTEWLELKNIIWGRLKQQEKKEELLGLYLEREMLLNNKPKTKYQIDIWKQRLKNNQYIQECLVKEMKKLK